MNNWVKLGITGIAIASGLPASAKQKIEYLPDPNPQGQKLSIIFNESDFKIEAADLIAGKLRDHVQGGQTDMV